MTTYLKYLAVEGELVELMSVSIGADLVRLSHRRGWIDKLDYPFMSISSKHSTRTPQNEIVETWLCTRSDAWLCGRRTASPNGRPRREERDCLQEDPVTHPFTEHYKYNHPSHLHRSLHPSAPYKTSPTIFAASRYVLNSFSHFSLSALMPSSSYSRSPKYSSLYNSLTNLFWTTSLEWLTSRCMTALGT